MTDQEYIALRERLNALDEAVEAYNAHVPTIPTSVALQPCIDANDALIRELRMILDDQDADDVSESA